MTHLTQLMAAKTEHLKELGEALLKSPPDIEKVVSMSKEVLENYHALLDNLELIFKKAGLSVEDACAAIGINKQQYYRRVNDKGMWTREEIDRLLKAILDNNKKKKRK